MLRFITYTMLHALLCTYMLSETLNMSRGDLTNDVMLATEVYRELCPFSRTCTQPARKEVRDLVEYIMPCCRQCSCEKSCWMTQSCCPDAEYFTDRNDDAEGSNPLPKEPASVTPSTACLTSAWPVVNRQHNGLNTFLKRYVTIISCPETFLNKTIVRMCQRQSAPKSLLELAFVTGSDGKIYRNEYCSICNGVRSYKRWPLQITCAKHQSLNEELTAKKVKDTDCKVWLEPEKSQVPDNLLCYLPDYDKCNITGRWARYDSNIAFACESKQFGVYQDKFDALYANVFCFLCNNDEASNDECPAQGHSWKAFLYPFTALVSLTAPVEDEYPKQSRCRVHEIYDQYADVCRELKCPLLEYASYGKCKPLFKKTDRFPVQFCARLTTSTQAQGKDYTDEIMYRTIRDDLEKFVDLGQGSRPLCPVSWWLIRVEPETSTNFSLVICAMICTSPVCSISDIMRVVNYFKRNVIEVNNVTFYSEVSPKHPNLTNLVGFNMKGEDACSYSPKYVAYFNKVKCATINISRYEYETAIRNNYISKDDQLDTFVVSNYNTPPDEMYEVCIDDYMHLSMSKSGGVTVLQNSVLPTLGLSLIVSYSTVNY